MTFVKQIMLIVACALPAKISGHLPRYYEILARPYVNKTIHIL